MELEKKPFRNTIIYIRTSTKEQNPQNQLRDCESIRPRIKPEDTFVDYMLLEEQQSAWSDYKERENFNKLLRLIKVRKVTNLIVWDLDRIYRDRKKLIAFFEFCKLHKCNIYSYSKQLISDIKNMPSPWNEAIHDLMLQIMGWLAEEESNKKSERIKAAVRRAGKITTSYKGNRWGRKPIPTRTRNLVLELHSQGKSIRQIAKERDLSVGSVHKIITQKPLEITPN